MALRLRRDVQKASYYVWFLGAEEAKGLRGEHVINSVLPYLIDRSRGQEPLKVTLQVSHKGIKILQGSSKHFIPHSAITSSVQSDDIVACVLLLYNPATKCPLHVHAYRCDSESTAETLHQQLQILINRPENQKRFEELETRLGILPPLSTSGNKSITTNATSSLSPSDKEPHSQKQQYYQSKQQSKQRRQESSPKRFSSSLGSDTGNSTRESECSEENSGGSPISRSPPIVKSSPLPQPNNELFDSLAAELRAKLNGNGPPILLPPRDYDTVHRSKGNLTAIELRRCRNALIVGGTKPNASNGNGKQVSSRGSSGIGSDLAPSPERQEINSSSDDEHWSNEADNSVIAIKPSQISMERTVPAIIPHQPLLNRKSAVKPPEDNYLRDLPAKPYKPRQHGDQSNVRDIKASPVPITGKEPHDSRSKTPSSTSWSREDEIKPIIMRPIDYDAKFHRVIENEEQKQNYSRRGGEVQHAKLRDTDKYNEINHLLNKKLNLNQATADNQHRYNKHKSNDVDDYVDSDPSIEKPPMRASSNNYGKENLTDKQKFLEYTSKKQHKPYSAEEARKYGGRHRYVDPADLPFDPPPTSSHKKYAAAHHSGHRSTHSPNRSDLGHHSERRNTVEPERRRRTSHERETETDRYGHSNERNPYREPESIPYIQSIEKMMKSSAMRYKSYDSAIDSKENGHTKLTQRKSYPKHNEEIKHERDNKAYVPRERARADYAPSAGSGITSREGARYKNTEQKMRHTERIGSRYDLTDEREPDDYRVKRRGSVEPTDRPQIYRQDWSDDDSPSSPPVSRSRSRSRDEWERNIGENWPSRNQTRDSYERQDYGRDIRQRESTSSKHTDLARDMRDQTPERFEQRRHDSRNMPLHERESKREGQYRPTERIRDHSREYLHEHTRDFSPDTRSGSDYRSEYVAEKHHGVIANAKSLSNLAKGYRHSYAEPVFARGRVGLAAVNPY